MSALSILRWSIDFPPPLGSHTFARGFSLQVSGDQSSWVYRYSVRGKRRVMGLGAFFATSVEQAERAMVAAAEKWHEAALKVAAGEDPIEKRKEQRREGNVLKFKERAEGLTLRRASREYFDACVDRRVSTRYALQWAFRFENDVPGWLLDTPLIEVTSALILKALADVNIPQARVDVARQRIDQVGEWATARGRLFTNPGGVRRNTRTHWVERFGADEAVGAAEERQA